MKLLTEIKKSLLLLTFCLISVPTIILAQDFESTDLAPQVHSPEASTFGNYANLPFNLHTGTPNISIPIYNIEYGGMSVPITLSYDASGVKVEEIASPVGLKWNLDVGGSVVRSVRGTYDEGNFYAAYEGNISTRGYYVSYGLTDLRNNINDLEDDGGILGIYLQSLSKGLLDGQPDMFSVSGPDLSSRFFFDENRTPVVYDSKDIKVEEDFYASGGNRSRFMGWEIKREDGVKLTFGSDETAIEKNYSATIGDATSMQWQDNSWFLSEMHNPQTNRTISFEYVSNNYTTANISDQTVNTCMNYTDGTGCSLGSREEIYGLASNYQNPNILMQSNYRTPLLSKIIAGDLEITFLKSGREDLLYFYNAEPYKIDEIHISYQGECIKKFIFNYDYFTSDKEVLDSQLFGEPISSTSKKRLKLIGLTEVSCLPDSETKEHTFYYHEEHDLPPRLSFAQDRWGYYNGEDDNESMYPDLFPYYDNDDNQQYGNREVNVSYGKQGTLKKIVYPTGGAVEFNYETHKNDEPVQKFTNWVNLKSIDTGSGGPGTNPVVISEYTFTADQRYMQMQGTIYGWTDWNQCIPSTPIGPVYEIIDNTTGLVVKTYDNYGSVDADAYNDTGGMLSVSNEFYLVSGRSYTVKVYGYGQVTSVYYETDVVKLCYKADFNLRRLEELPPTDEDYNVGGLRVASILYKDQNGNLLNEKNYEYSNSNLISNPQFLYPQSYDTDKPILALGSYFFIENWEPAINFYEYCKSGDFYLITPRDPYTPEFSGPHISYSNVKEISGEGFSEYTFFPPETYDQAGGYGEIEIPIKPIVQNPQAGKLVYKVIKDENNQIKSETQYFYLTQNIGDGYSAFSASDVSGSFGLGFREYKVYPEFMRLTKSTSKNIENGIEFSTVTNYTYGSNNHHQITNENVYNSKGDHIITDYLYPPDLSAPTSAENTMLNDNRVTEILESSKYINGKLLVRYRKSFDVKNGLVVPVKIEKVNLEGEVLSSTSYTRYDSYGNILEFKGNDGLYTSIIWGFNQSKPVAVLNNTQFSAIENITGFGLNYHAGTGNLSPSDANDLRAALPEAIISSYSYSPLFGVKSQTDSNGVVKKFEYDDLGRLKEIRQNDDLIKTYKYHYLMRN